MPVNTEDDYDKIARLQLFYEKSCQGVRDSIARDTNYDWLMQNIRFGVQYPEEIFLRNGTLRTDWQLELQLKNTWWKTIEAAKLYPANDEGRQYKLIAWIAGAKARAPVKSTTQDPYVADGDKILWRDLPFFETALEEAWEERAKLTKEAWTNLNAFVARLAAVTGMDLMRFGLMTIRDALEEQRPVFGSPAEVKQDVRSVADLLPATLLWLRHLHAFIMTTTIVIERAIKESNKPPSGYGEDIAPGPLALEAGVPRSGLSLARKHFWRMRLLEIGREKNDDVEGEEDLDKTPEVAHDFARKMATWNLSWPYELRDVPGYEEPIKYTKDAA